MALWSSVALALNVQAAPTVVASIKPLQLVAAAITDGVTTPVLVMNAGQDPHHASLRPSERRSLQQAALVLWVGPILEQPLTDVIAELKVPVLTAQQLPDITLLDSEGVTDPHLWLDSRNARHVANALMQQLQQLDPEHAAQYQDNFRRFSAQLDQTDIAIANKLQPLKAQQWAVSHHAFRYFAAQFALQEPIALTDSSNETPGVRSTMALREAIANDKVQCLLTEPTENQLELDSLLDGKTINIVAADVLGVSLPVSATAYGELLTQLGTAMTQCFGDSNE
ncbi:MAG: zinc ABC transporter substrate-binding protein [Pseudomonadota bacterium]